MESDNLTICYGQTQIYLSRKRYIEMWPTSLIATALQDHDASVINIEHSDVTPNILILLDEIIKSGKLIISDDISPEEYSKAGRYLLIDEIRLLGDVNIREFIKSNPNINLLNYESLKDRYRTIMDYAIRRNCVLLARFLFDHVASSEEDSKFLVIASMHDCPEILRLLLKRVDDPSQAYINEGELSEYLTNQAIIVAVGHQLIENIKILLSHDKIGLECRIGDIYAHLLEICKLTNIDIIDLIMNDHRFDASEVSVAECLYDDYLLRKLLSFPSADPTANEYSCLKQAIMSGNISAYQILIKDSRVRLTDDIVSDSISVLYSERKRDMLQLVLNDMGMLTPDIMIHDILATSPDKAKYILSLLRTTKFYPEHILNLRGKLQYIHVETVFNRYLTELGMI